MDLRILRLTMFTIFLLLVDGLGMRLISNEKNRTGASIQKMYCDVQFPKGSCTAKITVGSERTSDDVRFPD